MRLSVVIPCHEHMRELERVLAALVAQQPRVGDVEVLLIDNNSSVESPESVHRRFRDRLPITLVQQPGLPDPFALGRARNAALRLALGEWVATLDADCMPNPGYLDAAMRLVARYADTPTILGAERVFVSAAGLAAETIIEDPGVLSRLPVVHSDANYQLSGDRRLPELRMLPDVQHPWDYLHGGNTLFRRADALAAGGYDEAFDGHWGYEDVDFAYRMITAVGCVARYAAGMYVYHQEPEGVASHRDRYDKAGNPNWRRICGRIEGYAEHKMNRLPSSLSNIRY